MNALSDVIPAVVSQITGEPISEPIQDVDVGFLRVCAQHTRGQDVRVSKRLDAIAERLERAARAGQLLPVRDAT